MAYVAMNHVIQQLLFQLVFLNGVCRHELPDNVVSIEYVFLNGVCRHEPLDRDDVVCRAFLNGVCRHEPGKRPAIGIS